MLQRRKANRHNDTRRAFASFDAMFSIIPALVMLLFVIGIAHFLTSGAVERMHRQEVFDKLVSVADYVVKQGAARTEMVGSDQVYYPNWVVQDKVENDAMAKDLMDKAGLADLGIGLDSAPAGHGSTCIYRLVVVGDDKKIEQLFVCGD